MGSTTGRLFRVTTFGESHGPAIGAVIDGCPPGVPLTRDQIQACLDRRRPGASPLASCRGETDQVEILSGVFEGLTLGTPIGLLIRNQDADPRAYAPMKDLYRPSHADFSTEARYGHRDWRGGGRASARETACRVAAGAVADQVLAAAGMRVLAWVSAVGAVDAAMPRVLDLDREGVDATPVRCPDPAAAALMEAEIRTARKAGDSVGGIIDAVALGVPAGLGDPVFSKLEADLASALMSIPAAKGVESGAGFALARMRGSEANDTFEPGAPPGGAGAIRTRTNRSGGIQGGISNGMPLTLRVAFKPVATIFQQSETVDRRGRPAVIQPKGRHDPCVVPRAVPVVEAMVALVLADHWLRWRAIRPEGLAQPS